MERPAQDQRTHLGEPEDSPRELAAQEGAAQGRGQLRGESASTRSSMCSAATVRMLPTASLAILLALAWAASWSPAKPFRNACCNQNTTQGGQKEGGICTGGEVRAARWQLSLVGSFLAASAMDQLGRRRGEAAGGAKGEPGFRFGTRGRGLVLTWAPAETTRRGKVAMMTRDMRQLRMKEMMKATRMRDRFWTSTEMRSVMAAFTRVASDARRAAIAPEELSGWSNHATSFRRMAARAS